MRLKKTKGICLFTLLVLISCGKKTTGDQCCDYKTIVDIPTTPVKDQGKSPLCWTYAMLATIESEHLAMGDSVNLSTTYITRMMLKEKAQEYYFSKGTHPISLRGMGIMAVHYLNQYGAEPYDSYQDQNHLNTGVLCRKVEKLTQVCALGGKGLDRFNEEVDELLDNELGFMPGKYVFMLGAQYTPKEFATSVCAPKEYLSLTSFSHHPFHQAFVLEVPDNQMKDSFYNLPLNELMKHIHDAVYSHHPVCWEGDISNADFHEGFVTTTRKTIDQTYRQRLFERLETTDDHAMEIVGIVSHKGKTYYKCKNSWGKDWGDHGFVYLSATYVALNTTAVFMSRKAYDGER